MLPALQESQMGKSQWEPCAVTGSVLQQRECLPRETRQPRQQCAELSLGVREASQGTVPDWLLRGGKGNGMEGQRWYTEYQKYSIQRSKM